MSLMGCGLNHLDALSRMTRLHRALVVALGTLGARVPAGAQDATRDVAGLAGCYGLTRGSWSRAFSDSTYHRLPGMISLDLAQNGRGSRTLRPSMPYPFGRNFPGTPRWSLAHDTVTLVWSDGFSPTILKLTRRDTAEWHGRAVALSDSHYEGEPPPPEAEVTARRTACPVGFDETSAAAAVRIPAGLDSAATEQWVASHQRACRGRFMRVYDETMMPNPDRDSLPYFRDARVLRAVQCLAAK